MKNTHSKRLLARFLTALGLSMNSMNSADALAKYGQIRENIKFYFNIGKDCKKREEKAQLDTLAGKIQAFVKEDDEFYDNDEKETINYFALKLYEIFNDILYHRKCKSKI